MTPPPTIPISSILVKDRQRIDHSNIDGLKESLAQYGTIEPIIICDNSAAGDSFPYRLIAGGRRLLFLQDLGMDTLHHGSTYVPNKPGYILGEELSPDALHELELEENIRRKEMTWQERCLNIATVHRLKTIRMAKEGVGWTMRMAGEVFGVSKSRISEFIRLADGLREPASPLWKCESSLDGMRYLLELDQKEAEAELARRGPVAIAKMDLAEPVSRVWPFDGDTPLSLTPLSSEKDRAKERYLCNPYNKPEGFEAYYTEKQKPQVVSITPRLHLGDALAYLADSVGRFDHIITDPPYAIDMRNLAQSNVGMARIDSVEATHIVGENIELLAKFIPLAFTAIKEKGTLCIWSDYSMWADLHWLAVEAGFEVQRWPLVWIKTHPCMNSAAQYNFTKTSEIALICRKPGTVLCKVHHPSHVIAAHDETKALFDHPFVKPFAIWKHLIEGVSFEGQSICDPFMGEGSSILSMLKLNRNWFGCELEEHHYNKCLEHVKKHFLAVDKNTEFV